MDDWRGEHLIRTRKAHHQGLRPDLVSKYMAPKGFCAFPGCDAKLGRKNTSGVCVKHTHSKACTCKGCML